MTEKSLYKKIKKFHVLIFFAASVLAAMGILYYRNNSGMQFLIITALVIGYLTWAINYHRLDKSLNLEVVLEYILTALLVLIIFYGILI